MSFAAYTILVVATTWLATRAWYLFDVYRVSRGMHREVRHHCDDPANCPAEVVLADLQATYSKAKAELGLTLGVFALAVVAATSVAIVAWGTP